MSNVIVDLKWTYGKRHPVTGRMEYHGPGRVAVPEWYANALGLEPVAAEQQAAVNVFDNMPATDAVIASLRDAGWTAEKLAEASVDDLTPIAGIGEVTAGRIIAHAKETAGGAT